MKYGGLHTNKSWGASLQDLKLELDKWGIKDYILPTYDESKRKELVVLKVAINGKWTDVSCGRWSSYQHNGLQRNLRALVMAVESARLADQRGIGGLLHELTEHLSLPSPAGDSHYAVLGVAPDASKLDMVTAYREKLLVLHPDKGGDVVQYERLVKAGQALGIVDEFGHIANY